MFDFDVESVAKQDVQLRDFRDIGSTREAVLKAVEDSYRNKVVEDDNFALRFLDVGYGRDKGYTKAEEKKAIMKRRSLTSPLVGRLQFVDKRTGQVISEDEKPRSLAQVPYMSSSGLFIDNGSQYAVANQSRLRPGIYTRRKQNGNLETQFNIIPGTGRGFRLNLEPETGLFRMQAGQSKIKLYPLLKDLGVSDDVLRETWGEKLFEINKSHDDKEDKRVSTRRVLDKLGRYADKEAASPEEVRESLKSVFDRMRLDTEVTTRTLGKPYDRVGVEPLLHSTSKLLSILRKEPGVREDSRDSLVYQSFYSPEDFFREHVEKDAGKLQKSILHKLKYLKDTKKVPNNYFSKQLRSVLLGSGLSATIQQMNPLEAADLRSKVTRMGEGGMGSIDAVDDAAREIHPSQFGFIDAIRTPECYDEETEVMTASGWKFWSDVTSHDSLACQVNGRLEYHRPLSLYAEHYEGTMYGSSNKLISYLVTPNHRMWVAPYASPTFRVECPKKVSKRRREFSIGGHSPLVEAPSSYAKVDTDTLAMVLKLKKYTTPSKKMAEDINKVLFDKGVPSQVSRIDSGTYLVSIRSTNRCSLRSKRRSGKGDYYRTYYKGKVYCAEVPGGLLYVRRNNSYGFWCGNSTRLGLDQRLASGVMKGSDNKIYQQVLDRKTGEKKVISAQEFSDSPIAFPKEDTRIEPGGTVPKKIRAMHNGEVKYMDRDLVPYSLDSSQRMFSPITHFVPMFSAIKAQRTLMGTRMQSQALPLAEPEAPYVQTKYMGGDSINKEMAEEAGAVFSDSEGVVTKVDAGSITIRKPDGTKVEKELYDNLPYNQKSYIHNTPLVKPGQKVRTGQLLAKSNYTDDEGSIAIGKNALVGYHMMDGMTHEDAIVISEGASRKFATQRMYNTKVERGDRVKDISKSKYVAKYGGKFTKKQLDKISNEGVVKPGTVVEPGDPLVLAVGEAGKSVQSSLGKSKKSRFIDSSEIWEHDEPGVVTDVDKTSKGWNVSVKSQDKVRVGDKLSNFHGGKGVVAKIIPDDEILHTEEGEPLDLILNPTGVIGRVNPSQIAESALGKVAHKTGKRYVLDPFSDESFATMAWKELKKHGLNDTEILYDPKKDRAVPDVFTGRQYFVNLHHLASSKLGARSTAGYTMEGLPAKGGPEGAKRLDTLGLFALLSSGATETIKDAKSLRGQRNDEYWKLFRLGFRPPEPSESLANTKLENSLIASGVNVRKKGTKTQVMPLLDEDIDKLVGSREITVPDTVNFNTMENVKGGLFDVALTGGQNGTKWSYIGLSEPLPNPIMEDPIKTLLGLKKKQFEDIIAGKEELTGDTGGSAIQKALSKLNIDREIAVSKDYIRSGKKSDRDKMIKKIGVLEMLKKTGIKPEELVLSKVPVLPPVFRPVTKMEGVQLVDDANYLYKELMEANDNVKQYKEEFDDTLDTQADLYKALKAVTGLGEPVSKESSERGVRGILKKVMGRSPKLGQFQRKVLTTNLDLVGRGVIVPNPELDVDQVGIPEKMAWSTFKPFIIRSLVKRGMKATDALDEWEKRGERASKVLLEEMEERPVIINRAPSWHKFNMTGHMAKPVAGDAIELPIPILAGLGADFDGDSVQVHVPVSEEARNEIKNKLFPSKMLYSPKTYSVQMKPEHAFMTGIFAGSGESSRKVPQIFENTKEAIKAYKRGDLDPTDPVIIRKNS